MEGSNLSYGVWAIAIYRFTKKIEGTFSIKLNPESDIRKGSAWFLPHRIRKAFNAEGGPFAGPLELNETYMRGQR